MKTRVTFKDVPIGDRNYRLTKMDSRLGCWLFSTLAYKADANQILSALGKCTKEEFDEVQGQALRFVFRLDKSEDGTVFPMAVLAPNGMWVDKDLADDPAEVFQLTSAAILFNIDPFLVASKSTDQPASPSQEESVGSQYDISR